MQELYIYCKMSNAESDCEFVCSRGILKSCDVHSALPISSIHKVIYTNIAKLKEGDSLYICSSAIPDFIQTIFPSIRVKFILVSGDCDEACPFQLFPTQEAFIRFVEDERIIRWYSQNTVYVQHPKLVQIPIGLDYHTMSAGDHEWGKQMTPKQQEDQLKQIAIEAEPLRMRELKAYANYHFHLERGDRQEAFYHLPRELVEYEPTLIPREDTWQKQTKYAFVISPRGAGHDCHRTWEALCLGCIPIMKKSELDPLFRGLPVLLVENWSDVTRELLESTVSKIERGTFQMEKLLLSYWMDKIKNAHH